MVQVPGAALAAAAGEGGKEAAPAAGICDVKGLQSRSPERPGHSGRREEGGKDDRCARAGLLGLLQQASV